MGLMGVIRQAGHYYRQKWISQPLSGDHISVRWSATLHSLKVFFVQIPEKDVWARCPTLWQEGATGAYCTDGTIFGTFIISDSQYYRHQFWSWHLCLFFSPVFFFKSHDFLRKAVDITSSSALVTDSLNVRVLCLAFTGLPSVGGSWCVSELGFVFLTSCMH